MNHEVFISYKHQDGYKIASYIRKRIQSYKIPRKLLDIFDSSKRIKVWQDTAYMRATDKMFEEIIRPAVQASNFLIVICTESLFTFNKQETNWVKKEVEAFLEKNTANKIIIVQANRKALAIDDVPSFLNVNSNQQYILDFRSRSFFNFLRFTKRNYTKEFSRLMGKLLDVPPARMPELMREEEIRYFISLFQTGTFVLLIIFAVAYSLFVTTERAGQQRDNKRLLIAKKHRSNPDLALQALRAVEDPKHTYGWIQEAVRVLQQPLSKSVYRDVDGSSAVFSPDGNWVLIDTSIGNATLISQNFSLKRYTLKGSEALTVSSSFSKDSTAILKAYQDEVRIWKLGQLSIPIILNKYNKYNITAAAINPNAKYVAVGTNKGVARIWDINNSNRQPLILNQHTAKITDVIFSNDGQWIATASADNTALLWPFDSDSMTLRNSSKIRFQHSESVDSISFNSQTTLVLTSSADGKARVWQMNGNLNREIFDNQGKKTISAIFSPNGKWILTTKENQMPYLWKTDDKKYSSSIKQHTSWALSSAFNTKSSHFGISGTDGLARIWSINKSEEPIVIRGCGSVIYSIEFSADDKSVITSCDDHTVKIWNSHGSNWPVRFKPDQDDQISWATFSLNGKYLAIANNNKIILWQINGAHKKRIIGLQNNRISKVIFSPDDNWVASISGDAKASIWHRNGQGRTAVLQHKSEIIDLQFSKNGQIMATLSSDAVKIWRFNDQNGKPTLLRTIEGNDNSLHSINFSSDGKLFVTADDQSSKIWALENIERTPIFYQHKRSALLAKFSPDGKWIATSDKNAIIRLWHSYQDKEPYKLDLSNSQTWPPNIYSLEFSPDNGLLLITSDNGIWVWSMKHPQKKPALLPKSDGPFQFAEFSPDGKRIISSGETVQIWNLESENEVITLGTRSKNRNYSTNYLTARFSPDGRRVLGVFDGANKSDEVHIWITPDANLLMQELWRVTNDCYPVEERVDFELKQASHDFQQCKIMTQR